MTEELPECAALQAALAATTTCRSTVAPCSPSRRSPAGDVHVDAVEDAKHRLACVRQVRPVAGLLLVAPHGII